MKKLITMMIIVICTVTLFAQTEVLTFGDGAPCSGTPTITDREGNVYATVQIGNQCWMRENLRTTHYADGKVIPAGEDHTKYIEPPYDIGEPYYYNYSSHSLPLKTRGYLYSWAAAMLVCPTGWHLPSKAEWSQLTSYLIAKSEYKYICGGNSSYIAKALSSETGWNTSTDNCAVGNAPSANNASGFGAVPAGYWSDGFRGADDVSYFWSSTEDDFEAYTIRLFYSSPYVGYSSSVIDILDSKRCGYSVRCLRDETGGKGSTTTTVIGVKSCPGTPTVTDIDGNVYNTVQIGLQCWMRENLRTTHRADGMAIPASGDHTSDTEPYYYNYSSHSLPLKTRGYLYNWSAAMVACPAGWHLPSNAEWTQLTDYVGSWSEYICGGNSSYIAKALASETGWKTYTGNCELGSDLSANNASGFGAVPAGGYINGKFKGAGDGSVFWSSTEEGCRGLSYDYSIVFKERCPDKDYGISVRCLRD